MQGERTHSEKQSRCINYEVVSWRRVKWVLGLRISPYQSPSRLFWTPTNHNLPPGNPPRTSPSQVLSLWDQTLVDRAGEQGDAVPAHLITEVLAGHADPGGAGGSQEISIQAVPLLRGGSSTGDGHSSEARTPVLLAELGRVKRPSAPKASNCLHMVAVRSC